MNIPIGTGRAVDLSQTIENGMTVYLGDPVPKISDFKRLEEDGVNVSVLSLGSHTGTHIDAPMHFIRGAKAVDQLSVESFVGEAAVLDLSDVRPGGVITAPALQAHAREVRPCDIVLVFTGMSR